MALRFKVPSAPMLAHFTKASPRADALDNLVSILARGTVQGSSRMIFGKKRVVCLFNATVTELSELLDHRNRRRYQPFGLAIDRRHAFRMGARPAIYLPRAEASKLLPVGELWRVVSLQMDGAKPVDWTFEREWRIAGELCFEARQAVALVDSWRDADAVFDRFEGHPPCAGVIPLRELFAPS